MTRRSRYKIAQIVGDGEFGADRTEKLEKCWWSALSRAALILGQLQDGLQEARTEADHATADQVCMAGDVATLFNELKAFSLTVTPNCTPIGRGWKRIWNRRNGHGGDG